MPLSINRVLIFFGNILLNCSMCGNVSLIIKIGVFMFKCFMVVSSRD